MVKHITALQLFGVWTGQKIGTAVQHPPEFPLGNRSCDGTEHEGDIVDLLSKHEVPTCSHCAVLYDEAMTAREEELGRRAKAARLSVLVNALTDGVFS